MADDESCIQARWLWNSVLGLTTLALAGLLAVIIALIPLVTLLTGTVA